MRPEDVGASGTRLVLGKHSGMRGLDARCRALGFHLRAGSPGPGLRAARSTTADTRQSHRGLSHRAGCDRRPGGVCESSVRASEISPCSLVTASVPKSSARPSRVLELSPSVRTRLRHARAARSAARRCARTASRCRRRRSTAASHRDAVLLGAVGDPAFDHLDAGQASRIGAAGPARARSADSPTCGRR